MSLIIRIFEPFWGQPWGTACNPIAEEEFYHLILHNVQELSQYTWMNGDYIL